MPPPTTGVYFSGSTPPAPPGDQVALPQTDGAQPEQSITFVPQQATTALRGTVKPDGTSITIDADGTIHATATVGGGGTGGGGGGGGGVSASGGAYVAVIPAGPKDGSNTQWTLPAPVLAGTAVFYFRNGVYQPQLGAQAVFSVQGTQLTTSTPLQSDDQHEFIYVQGTPNSDSGGGGSVNPGTAGPAIRGYNYQHFPASQFTIAVALPDGSQAGDLCIMYAAQGIGTHGMTTPSGFTLLDSDTGTTWLQWTYSHTLTSGDISTGSVSISQASSFFTGQGVVAIIVIDANTFSGVRTHTIASSVGSSGTDPISSDGTPVSGDLICIFASVGNSVASGASISISPGTVLVSNYSAAGNSQVVMLAMCPAATGVNTETQTTSPSAFGVAKALIVVQQ